VSLSALRASGRSPATLTQYTEALNCYLPWLGRAADTATRLDARRFQQHLLDTRSPGGAAMYLRTIKAMYGWAEREELVECNPFKNLSIRQPQDVQVTATPEQIEFLLRTASSQRERKKAQRVCMKCGVPVETKPGYPVCDDCGVDPRVNAKEKERRRTLRTYGLTVEDYDRLLSEQDGRCAICATTDPGKHRHHQA